MARGWTYTQCLVETEATYTRFPGVMGKDRVIRMHSSSSRLQTRHTHIHTHRELSISWISNTWPRVQQAFLESLGLVNKFVKSVLEQQRPTPRDSFVILSLPCARSCESIMFTVASRKKKFWNVPWKLKTLEKWFKILGKLFFYFFFFFFSFSSQTIVRKYTIILWYCNYRRCDRYLQIKNQMIRSCTNYTKD